MHQDIRGKKKETKKKKTLERSGASRHDEPYLKYLSKNQKLDGGLGQEHEHCGRSNEIGDIPFSQSLGLLSHC